MDNSSSSSGDGYGDTLSSSSPLNNSETGVGSVSINNSGSSNSTSSESSGIRSFGVQLPAALSLLRSPLSVLLEFSGAVPASSGSQGSEQGLAVNRVSQAQVDGLNSASPGEVSIQIIRQESGEMATGNDEGDAGGAVEVGEAIPLAPPSSSMEGSTRRDGSYQSYDIQQIARWIEQVLPFSLLLLVVFVRQHLQGIWPFFVFGLFHGS